MVCKFFKDVIGPGSSISHRSPSHRRVFFMQHRVCVAMDTDFHANTHLEVERVFSFGSVDI